MQKTSWIVLICPFGLAINSKLETDFPNRHLEQISWIDILNKHPKQTSQTDILNKHACFTNIQLFTKMIKQMQHIIHMCFIDGGFCCALPSQSFVLLHMDIHPQDKCVVSHQFEWVWCDWLDVVSILVSSHYSLLCKWNHLLFYVIRDVTLNGQIFKNITKVRTLFLFSFLW